MDNQQYNDSPLAGSEGDTLKTDVFAQHLAEFIQEAETPITIGLQGDWGTGKTSLINLIKSNLRLKKKELIHVIDVNTWHYSMFRQDEYIGIAIVSALVKELTSHFSSKPTFSDELKKVAGKTGRMLQAVVGNASIPGFGGVKVSEMVQGATDEDLSIENLAQVLLEFKSKFEEIISKSLEPKERIVFFVDDLDRIQPVKALEILETLKNFLEVDHCVYVLAIDYEIVQLGIAQKFGSNVQKTTGKSFFDKIIQVPFTMPTVSYDINGYLHNLLSNNKLIKANSTKQVVDKYVEFTETTIGRNPRSIKRAVNYTKLLRTIRDSNRTTDEKTVDDKERLLMYALVCMQIEWPELFAHFVSYPTVKTIENMEDWDYLDTLPQARKIFSRSADPEQVKQNISGFFDLLFETLDNTNVGSNDGDGELKINELAPLHTVLRLTKLTTIEQLRKIEDPKEYFWNLVTKNDNKSVASKYVSFLKKSKWSTNDTISFKRSTTKSLTLLMNRKQVGSWVTYKSSDTPFVFRLKMDHEEIISKLTEFNQNHTREHLSNFVSMYDRPQKAGIGDTEIILSEGIVEKKAIELLNALFRVVQEEYKS